MEHPDCPQPDPASAAARDTTPVHCHAPAHQPHDNGEAAAWEELNGEPIDTYTRADALADGSLVAVPERLRVRAGLPLPTALTRAAWHDTVEWTARDSELQVPQSPVTRLGRVLTAARNAMFGEPELGRAEFVVARIPRDGTAHEPSPVPLTVLLGSGDRPREVVLTVMLPDEVDED